MTIDISKIKVGDKITVELTVSGWAVSKHIVARDADGLNFTLPISKILSHTPTPPKPLEVGEKVWNNKVWNYKADPPTATFCGKITIDGRHYGIVQVPGCFGPGIGPLENYERAE